MPYNFLLIPIIFSYIILRYSYFFKYNLQRRSKEVLIFETIVVSIPIIFFSSVFNQLFKNIFPKTHNIFTEFFYKIYEPETKFFYSILLGSILFTLIIFCFQKIVLKFQNSEIINRNFFSIRAIRKYGDELENFIITSIEEGNPVQFTLKNGKVYIGFCSLIPTPGMNNFIKISPISSGFRDKETHKITINTDYYELMKQLLENDKDKFDSMMISFRKDEILTFNLYDVEVHNRFQNN